MQLPDKQLLRPDEVSEILNIQLRTIYHWFQHETEEYKKLSPIKVGQQWRIHTTKLKSFIETKKKRPGRPRKNNENNNKR